MILIVDNFDSFVHNLARYIRQLGQETLVIRNDDARLDELQQFKPSAILISPGPQTPTQSGKCLALIEQFHSVIPLIGVCLGHQAIVQTLGGKIVRANQPVHGRTSLVKHTGHQMFDNIDSSFTVCRYHSLSAASQALPDELEVTATSDDGEIMAVAHRSQKTFGIQFHPESILSESGYQLLANILKLCDIPCDSSRIQLAQNTLRV